MPKHLPISIRPERRTEHSPRSSQSKGGFLSIILISFLLFACAPKSPLSSGEGQGNSSASEATSTPLPAAIEFNSNADLIFLAMEENGYAHLFAYHPQNLPFTRLTSGEWNDTSPALSPDRKQLAFASDRNGYWDLYLLDLQSGGITQITDTPDYDSSPSWSPDGQWLVFETYFDDNLEIALVSATGPDQETIRLTQNAASDHSPAWAPDGRHVAFVSSRGGDSDIWLADLDLTGDERYQNLSNTAGAAEDHPVWNQDGSQLLWASISQTLGFSGIYIWQADDPERAARWIGDGNIGTWNEAGDQVIAVTDGPNQQFLSAYDIKGNLLLASIPLRGRVRGLLWGHAEMSNPFPDSFAEAAAYTPPAAWAPIVTPVDDVPAQRWHVVDLSDVQAPYPQMHDLTDEAFEALRDRLLDETGWDILASLENAFVPLTTSLEPGYEEDWLYTGRAFAINSLMANAGWMVAVREDVGAQTYWRLYIRCMVQDGSMGEPIHNAPWDLNARYDLDPLTYEQGGNYSPVPSGYWVDVTALAQAYGWERLPALPNWRSYYAGTRFTEFALTNGLSWHAAMSELYPEEALITPTRVLPPTLTPTRTPAPTGTRVPTRTPRITFTPSFTPTPIPPTSTPTLSPTPPTVIP
ncbi:MAG: TolB family protein [Chloroflexi bacterium]|nr:TolB family protein [Chloroflexota bacterium]